MSRLLAPPSEPFLTSRRELLKWAAAGAGSTTLGLTLGACPPPAIRVEGRYLRLLATYKGTSYDVRIERSLRTGPLTHNKTLTLRRYQGHATPRAREAQLMLLARTALAEEAFFHTLPDNTWTEVGLVTERGANAWKGYGIRLLPIKALTELFSGRVPGISRPRRIVNYHNHPIRFVRQTLRSLTKDPKYERLTYLPSSGDFFIHTRMQHFFWHQGTHFESRVAVPNAMISFDVSPALRPRILASVGPHALRETQIYESARLSFAKNDISRAYFIEILADRLRQAGIPIDAFRLKIDTRVPAVESPD